MNLIFIYLELFFWLLIALIFLIYLGYPLSLYLMTCVRGVRRVDKKEIFPTVSFLISVYNEEKVIREKIENSLNLNYPRELLEIIIVSDASSDKTDSIVQEYSKEGVKLIRQDYRKGKSSALNIAVPQSKGDIIVFSDANSIYESDAINNLVKNFNDESVGYVVGNSTYKTDRTLQTGDNEGVYWSFEQKIKSLETNVWSMVGADGAFYGIRRELFEPLKETDINDFINPLQIVLKGFRGVFEADSVCYEDSASDIKKEYKRKVRIVNRSLFGLLNNARVMDPLKVGIFSYQVIFHKLLRWMIPLFLALIVLSCILLSFYSISYQFLFMLMSCLSLLSFICNRCMSSENKVIRYFQLLYYFIIVNIASSVGIYDCLRGKVQTKWDTPRVANVEKRKGGYFLIFAMLLANLYSVYLLLNMTGFDKYILQIVFWSSGIILGYVYFGYLLFICLYTSFKKLPINKAEIYPEVALLICAFNEENVIEEKIKNCLDLDYPKDKLKIFISSDGSTDKTNSIIKKYVNRGIVLNEFYPRSGKTYTINSTIPKIKSEIVVFSDADTLLKENSIEKIVTNFNDKTVGCVSGNVKIRNTMSKTIVSEGVYQKYERIVQLKETDIWSIVGADGGMYAIRRKLFKPPSENIILDDFVISINVMRQGYRIVYDKEVIAYESSPVCISDEISRKTRIVAGAVQTIRQCEGVPGFSNKKFLFCYLSHKLTRWLTSIFLITIYFSNIGILFVNDWFFYKLLFTSQTIVYLFASYGYMKKDKEKMVFIEIPFYFCVVNLSSLIGLYKGLFDKQKVTWKKFHRVNTPN